MVFKMNYRIIGFVIFMVAAFIIYFSLTNYNYSYEPTAADLSNSVKVPIIMYHELKQNNNNKLAIGPWEFESDLKWLQKNGYTTINMTDLINYVNGIEELPEKPIILSFDDGYLNNYKYAFPLIKKYNVKIVLSIIGKDCDDFTKTRDSNLDYAHITWQQAFEMQSSGLVELQNHTYNLHKLSAVRYGCAKNSGESLEHYETVLTEDLIKCQNTVKNNTGFLPNTFTYPYGNVSKDSLPIIKKLGFQASLSCKYGINLITKNPDCLYCLKRISRYHNVSVQKTLSDALKTLRFVK